MAADYRRRLADNIRALLLGKNIAADRLHAKYVDGPKKGRYVSPRTIGYIISNNVRQPGVSLDVLTAIACSLGVEPYHLLVPELDPYPLLPASGSEDWIEDEVKRRLAMALPRAVRMARSIEASRNEEKESRRQEQGKDRGAVSPGSNPNEGARRGRQRQATKAKEQQGRVRRKTTVAA